MFCSACGSEVSEGLRFCNRCGASLVSETPESPPRLLAFIIVLSLAVAVVTIVGLFFILIMGTEMMGRRDSTAETYIFIFVLLLMVVGADALLVRQISRLLTVYLQTGTPQKTPAKGREVLKAPAPELAPLTAAAETTALHTTARDTEKMPADTSEQELPTRKL
jgi:hypothetical protein